MSLRCPFKTYWEVLAGEVVHFELHVVVGGLAVAVGVVVVVEGLLEALLSILRLAMLHTLVFPNLVFFSRSHSARYFHKGNQRLNIEDTV